MFNRRRLFVTLALASTTLVTIATSPPRPFFPGLSASHQTRAQLDTGTPTFSTHLTARLAASQNGGAVDAGALLVSLTAIATGCVVGVDTFSDAGVCLEVADFNNRPSLKVGVQLDGSDAGVEATQAGLRLFEACPVGSDCTQGLTVTVSRSEGETRPLVVELEVAVSARGGTVDPNAVDALTLTQP